MTTKAILKLSTVIIVGMLLIGGGLVFYMFNIPHRDVQASATDYAVKTSQIVREYLLNAEKANEKYLDGEGESKIIEVSGIVSNISEDFNGNKVVLLKSSPDEAGVSCTFYPQTNINVLKLKEGTETTLKGVIRSGASYDVDLDMYEHVIMELCNVVPDKK